MVVVKKAERATIVPSFSLDGGDELLRRHVHAQVDHLESAAFEHRGDEVLTDVVQVALHRADHYPACPLDARGQQQGEISPRATFIARAAMSSSGTKYSLHSNRLPTSSIAGIMHLLTNSLGSAPAQGLLGGRFGLLCISRQNGVVKIIERTHRFVSLEKD